MTRWIALFTLVALAGIPPATGKIVLSALEYHLDGAPVAVEGLYIESTCYLEAPALLLWQDGSRLWVETAPPAPPVLWGAAGTECRRIVLSALE